MTATPTGVVSARDEKMAEIIRKSTEATLAEIKEGGGDPASLMPPDEKEPQRPDPIPEDDWNAMSAEDRAAAVKPAETPAPAEKTDEEKEQERLDAEQKEKEEAERKEREAAVKTVKIKVDGKEVEVPEQEILEAGIRAKQKIETGDRRLEEATRLLEEAKRMKEALGGPSKDAPKPSEEVDARAIAHAIQYGSEEEATEALKKLRASDSKPNGLNAEQVAHLVDERTAFQTAVQWYRSDEKAKQIAADPNLHQVFLAKESQKRKAGDNRPYLELYQEIVGEIHDWMGAKLPKKDPLQDKRDRKSAAPQHPTSAASRQPAPTETPEPTPSQVIDQMRKARHQI